MEPNLTIILPTRNEKEAIGSVLDEIRLLPLKIDILVVDYKSSNGTREVILERVVRLIDEESPGKGNAMRTAFTQVKTPYVIMVNADYTYPLEYATTIYHILSLSGADVVLGYRDIKEKDSMSLLNSFGNWCLSLLASILYRKRVYDVCTGMWGFRTERLKSFNLTSEGFTLEADLFTNAVKGNCRIEQIPIAYRARLDGSVAKLKIWDGFKIGWFLIRRRFR